MAVLNATDYPELRESIADWVDATYLPDTKIERSIFRGEGEEEVVKRVGAYEDLNATKKAHARKAMVYMVAARIAETLTGAPYVSSDGNSQFVKFNGAAAAARLRGWAESELAEVVDEAAEPVTMSNRSVSVRTSAVW